MLVVMTAVACLLSYSDYVQAKALEYTFGFNLLWLTMIPATYAVFRAVLLLERRVRRPDGSGDAIGRSSSRRRVCARHRR